MKQLRIENPIIIDPATVANHISSGARVIVQYSKNCYSAEQLEQLNELAKIHGRNFEIRFYGHYSGVFDASVLSQIPDAQCVSVDCLTHASNLEALSQLRQLSELNLGVFELNDPDVLTYCNQSTLKSLTLGNTRKSNIDLATVSKCLGLESFHTTGHTKNISAISSLHSLQFLSLSSIRKKDGIGFVSDIPNLRALRLILGGRQSISEITSAQLESLEIIRVQGLEDIGDLGRFELLKTLLIEDQIRLAGIIVGLNPLLRDIKILNCKSFKRIAGLANLDMLQALRFYETAIDYNDFISSPLPKALQVLAFYTGKSKRDTEIQNDLKGRGFLEFSRQ